LKLITSGVTPLLFWENMDEAAMTSNSEIWWEPRDIRFTIEQCKWLISVLPRLRDGVWPADPRGNGYIPTRTCRPENIHAPFETAEMIAGEIEARLEACGPDGILVEAFYGWGKDTRSLMKYFHLDQKTLSSRVGRCLIYISGWKRKPYRYEELSAHRKPVRAGKE
jgi:hypothetical protein